MTYNPNQISPPEPHPCEVADCSYCGCEVYRDDMVDLGRGHGWCCDNHMCLRQALIDTVGRAAIAEIIVKRLRDKRAWRWVTRDPGAGYVVVWHGKRWRARPHLGQLGDEWYEWDSPALSYFVCAAQFRSIFGLTIPTDRPVKVEFEARILEEATP